MQAEWWSLFGRGEVEALELWNLETRESSRLPRLPIQAPGA